MPTVVIDTLSATMGVVAINPTTGALANITVSSTIVEPVPIAGLPPALGSSANGGVFACGKDGYSGFSAVKLSFFGVGTNGQTALANVYGWEEYKSDGTPFSLWVPTVLATFTAITLNTSIPGVAGTDIPATNFFASAMTLGVGNSGVSCEVVSPGAAIAEIAHAVVSTKGAKFIEVRFAVGTATSINAAWKGM